ncbi:hypothetical protein G6F65_019692 [Rhizopus arrhizus]|nr:hypothetical protein G6F65_019692 [Rhizopus arrhizus]
MGNLAGSVHSERLIQNHPDGLTFLKGLKGIGATTPAPGRPPLSAAALRRVLAAFDEQGATVTYHLAYDAGVRHPGARLERRLLEAGPDRRVRRTRRHRHRRATGPAAARTPAFAGLRAASAAVALGRRHAGRHGGRRDHHRAADDRRPLDRGRRGRPVRAH